MSYLYLCCVFLKSINQAQMKRKTFKKGKQFKNVASFVFS